MEYTKEDLENFCNNIWENNLSNNNGGMGAPDLFSFYFTLNKIKPKVVIESGVWNGISTKLIRKTCPDAIIICLDPREIPYNGYRDDNINTIYYLGNNFIDFKDINLDKYNKKDILCFFDCHQNAYLRLTQCIEKGITHIFLNDNYPVNCGSHFTIEHLIHNDKRYYIVNDENKNKMINGMEIYYIFPNIYPGLIKTGEGYFECKSFLEDDENEFDIFKIEREKYRWNTYIKLKL